jgi:hypothetical protein
MRFVVIVVIAAVAEGLQSFLGSRKHWILGGLVPFAFLVYTVWYGIFHKADMNGSTVVDFILIFAGLLAIWFLARADCQKKKKQELEKMEAQDLKRK